MEAVATVLSTEENLIKDAVDELEQVIPTCFDFYYFKSFSTLISSSRRVKKTLTPMMKRPSLVLVLN